MMPVTRRVRFYPVICLAVAALLMVLVCPACGNRNEGSDFAFADLTGSEMILGIHYLGHASFLLQFSNGITVLTDYGASRAWGLDSPVYGFDGFLPAVVTLSHEHDDHAGGILPAGIAHHLTGTDSLEIAGLTICPIRVCELDPTRPDNSAFLFTWRGFTILHAGDIQAWERNLTDQGVRDRVRESFPKESTCSCCPSKDASP